MPKIKTTPFDPAEVLDTPEAIAAYLDDALIGGDPSEIADALGVCMRARNVSQLARDTGLNRQTLYRTFSPSGNPELGTLLKVIDALGVRLSAIPVR